MTQFVILAFSILASACARPPTATHEPEALPKKAAPVGADATDGASASSSDACLSPSAIEPSDATTAKLGWDQPAPGQCRPDVPQACAAGCRAGDGYACFMLSSSYTWGVGIKKDPVCGVQLARTGCELGNQASCSALGHAYLKGTGVEKDLGRAEQLLAPSCDAGVPVACIGIAEAWLEKGERVDNAIALLKTTCDRDAGYHAACHTLGTLYRDGKHVPANVDIARALFERGCTGFKPSCRALESMAP